MNKKAELVKEGTILHGPIVPEWFVGDCSIPTWFLKKLLDATMGHDACRIHDWIYMLIAILYEPGSIEWQMQLHMADAQLKWNLTLLRKRRRVGRLWGWIYYRGVRMHFIGGRRAINRDPKNHPRRPIDAQQVFECLGAATEFNGGELTNQAREIFGYWSTVSNGWA